MERSPACQRSGVSSFLKAMDSRKRAALLLQTSLRKLETCSWRSVIPPPRLIRRRSTPNSISWLRSRLTDSWFHLDPQASAPAAPTGKPSAQFTRYGTQSDGRQDNPSRHREYRSGDGAGTDLREEDASLKQGEVHERTRQGLREARRQSNHSRQGVWHHVSQEKTIREKQDNREAGFRQERDFRQHIPGSLRELPRMHQEHWLPRAYNNQH